MYLEVRHFVEINVKIKIKSFQKRVKILCANKKEHFFAEWLSFYGYDEQFETLSKENLAVISRKFYPSARQKSDDGEEGLPYAKQSLIIIRSAIN